jgi:hypothetical protein
MDYTLAQYNAKFEMLAFEGAKKKLVNMLGYPQEVLNLAYDPISFLRGLVIDKVRGNVLKMDRHKYVRVVYHGLTQVGTEQRKNLYLASFDKMYACTGCAGAAYIEACAGPRLWRSNM